MPLSARTNNAGVAAHEAWCRRRSAPPRATASIMGRSSRSRAQWRPKSLFLGRPGRDPVHGAGLVRPNAPSAVATSGCQLAYSGCTTGAESRQTVHPQQNTQISGNTPFGNTPLAQTHRRPISAARRFVAEFHWSEASIFDERRGRSGPRRSPGLMNAETLMKRSNLGVFSRPQRPSGPKSGLPARRERRDSNSANSDTG